MKAVSRLICTYFMGSKVLRVLTIGGLLLLLIDFSIFLTQPESGEILWIAGLLGMVAFFLGSSLMPVIFGRLARSHSIGILPRGRFKLLASAFFTTVIVAIPAALVMPAAFISDMSSLPEILRDPAALTYVLQMAAISFTAAMLWAGWLYVAMWFMTHERNLVGTFKALLVIVVLLFAPARELRDLTMTISWNLVQIAVVWIVFGAGFLLWPRYRSVAARRGPARSARVLTGFGRSLAGREFDVMLGASNPWQMIAAQVLPILIATRFVQEFSAMWLFFLTIFSVVSGAIAGEAAGRSRALWLRGNWTREELFSQVERSFWRHNSYVVGSLLVVLVGVGSHAGLPVSFMLAGVPLLVLGAVLSLYLGLMVTRGLRWIEGLLGAAVMLTLMSAAILILQEEASHATVFAIEGGLAVLAFFLRSTARRRWTEIDWMACRPDRAMVVRGA